MKKLNYVPIYRGEWNMTEERHSQIVEARRYTKRINKRREFWIELRNQLLFGILFLSIMLGLFFTLLFM